jgi:uncharacterized protein (DUF952 family)
MNYTHQIVDMDGYIVARATSEAAAIARRAKMCKGRHADLLMLHIEPVSVKRRPHPSMGGRSR